MGKNVFFLFLFIYGYEIVKEKDVKGNKLRSFVV